MLNTQLREDGLTLEEVAAELGVSPERARQIEMRALRKCRQWCQRHGWQFEDLVPACRSRIWRRSASAGTARNEAAGRQEPRHGADRPEGKQP